MIEAYILKLQIQTQFLISQQMASYLTNNNVYKQFPIIRIEETQAEQQLESFSASSSRFGQLCHGKVTTRDVGGLWMSPTLTQNRHTKYY